MKNSRRLKSSTIVSLLAVLFLLCIGIYAIIMIASYEEKARPLKSTAKTQITTTESMENTNKTFSASLYNIVADQYISESQNQEISYHNVLFQFTCDVQDKQVCSKGKSIMKWDDNEIELYSFEKVDDNYLNKKEDYYIIFAEEYIVLTNRERTKIYDKMGRELNIIENSVTRYEENKKEILLMYPVLSENNLYLYRCDKKTVNFIEVSLKDQFRIKTIDVLKEASC